MIDKSFLTLELGIVSFVLKIDLLLYQVQAYFLLILFDEGQMAENLETSKGG